ncbi:MAG: hypothetical protein IKZ48_06830 [Prevotella sp.]|nr:hypothetical protein [Prevotella sp.]
MKKIYQNPKITIVKIQAAKILAGSDPEGFNGGLNVDGGAGSSALSRGGFWEDDSDDEW